MRGGGGGGGGGGQAQHYRRHFYKRRGAARYSLSRSTPNQCLVRAVHSSNTKNVHVSTVSSEDASYYVRNSNSLRRVTSHQRPYQPKTVNAVRQDVFEEAKSSTSDIEQLCKHRSTANPGKDESSAVIHGTPAGRCREAPSRMSECSHYIKSGHSLKRISTERVKRSPDKSSAPSKKDNSSKPFLFREQSDREPAHPALPHMLKIRNGGIGKLKAQQRQISGVKRQHFGSAAPAESPACNGSSSRNRTLDRRKLEQCLFFARFGRCKQAESSEGCPFKHDRAAVGICREWLAGRCDGSCKRCDLSHVLVKDKMPVCERFLHGHCSLSSSECPYLHVSHAFDTAVCDAFALRGHCQKGRHCDFVHSWDCLPFVRTGKCPSHATCRLRHWSAQKRERAQIQNLSRKPPSDDSPREVPGESDCGRLGRNQSAEDPSMPRETVVQEITADALHLRDVRESKSDTSDDFIAIRSEDTPRSSTSQLEDYISLN